MLITINCDNKTANSNIKKIPSVDLPSCHLDDSLLPPSPSQVASLTSERIQPQPAERELSLALFRSYFSPAERTTTTTAAAAVEAVLEMQEWEMLGIGYCCVLAERPNEEERDSELISAVDVGG